MSENSSFIINRRGRYFCSLIFFVYILHYPFQIINLLTNAPKLCYYKSDIKTGVPPELAAYTGWCCVVHG